MNKSEFSFEFITQDDQARLCKMYTPRGVIETPVFMPVGTIGSVKAIFPQELKKLDIDIILANTYHLMQRPGDKLINELLLPISVEPLDAGQSKFFKTVYQNPARDNSKQFLDRE